MKISLLLQNLLQILGGLLFALLLCELFLHLSGWGQYYDQQVSIPIAPNKNLLAHCYSSNPQNYFPINLRKSKQQGKFFAKQFQLSSPKIKKLQKQAPYCISYNLTGRKRGFRPQAEQNILLLGNSFVFGEGLKEKHTLAAFLGEQYPKYNFQNYGKSKGNIKSVYRLAQELLIDKQIPHPKAALYFYNLHEILHVSKEKKKTDSSKRRMLPKSYLYQVVQKTFFSQREKKPTLQHDSKGIRKTIQYLEDLSEFFKAQKVSFFVLLYPILYKEKGRYRFQRMHHFLSKRCQEMKINCIDLASVFKNDRELSPYRTHSRSLFPNQHANKKIVRYLKRKFLLKF